MKGGLMGLLLWASLAVGASAARVGVDPAALRQAYVRQSRSQWCWAACTEMLLRCYGVEVRQSRLVEAMYGSTLEGRARNHAGSVGAITGMLQGSHVDATGRSYSMRAECWNGPPAPRILQWELSAKRPIMVVCSLDPGNAWRQATHAVLLVAGDSTVGTDGYPSFSTLTILDPAGAGMVTVAAPVFLRRVLCYWTVRVQAASAAPAR
jgi:hypothetical protein